MQNDSHFLDSKSLIALLFLVLSWFAWNQYMKNKYPTKKPVAKLVQEEEIKQQDILKKPVAKLAAARQTEDKLYFAGENMDIVFSSYGFGIKQVTLNKYLNRQKKQITFQAQSLPFFSNSFFKNETHSIPFKIQKQGISTFVGLFSSPDWIIKKTVEVDDKNFILKNTIDIQFLNQQQARGISLVSHQEEAQIKSGSALLKLLTMYGQNILQAFVFYDGDQSSRLTKQNIEERPETFSKVQVVALGEKYFGQAFINKSSIYPSLVLTQDKKQIQTRLDYEFLHFKDQSLKYELFLGPKAFKKLQNLDKAAQAWLDFGFFSWLARPMLLFLKWLFSWCNNWGLSIILLTFFVRLALLPINIRSYKSMKVMQNIQPQIKKIKEKYKQSPKQMNLEVMNLMKQQKANPLGGCLPLFIQLPVFFALYRVLGESIELYQAPFFLWIQDLSIKDPYFVLPVLGGLVYFVQQGMTTTNLPKEQARLLKIMPLVFSAFMLGLPSGLTLYIFVSGLFGLVQQMFFVKLGTQLQGEKYVKSV